MFKRIIDAIIGIVIEICAIALVMLICLGISRLFSI